MTEATERFKEAAEAFEVLSDQRKRSIYDRYGHAGLESQAGGARHFTDVEDIFSAFGDIFGDLFGGRAAAGAGESRRGRDVRCDVTLSLREAATGQTKTVEYDRHERCDQVPGAVPDREAARRSADTAGATDRSCRPPASCGFRRPALRAMVPGS